MDEPVNVEKEPNRLAQKEKDPWFTQKFVVKNVQPGYTPELGGCLVIQCENGDHELEVWYSPQGKTGNDNGRVHIESRNRQES